MLHKDYLLEVINQFVDAVSESLGLARKDKDPGQVKEAEQAVANLLDLDAEVALKLAPTSLVQMLVLSGVGDALAEYVVYALREVSKVYEEMGEIQLAELRLAQANQVAASFNVDPLVVPHEFLELYVDKD